MNRLLSTLPFFLGISSLLVVASCSGRALKDAQPLELDALSYERVDFEVEHRSAWKIPAGSHAISFDDARPESFLRFGVLPENSEGRVDVTVFQNGKSVLSEAVRQEDSWFDTRMSLNEGGTYQVLFASEEPFWISHCAVAEPGHEKPNVLVFLVDTLRPDRLGCYGYERNTSPNVDEFASHAIRFTRTTAQSSWTRSSMASTLTSTYPGVHGAEDRPDVVRSGLPSLAASFGERGYATVGINSNINLRTMWGFGGDFSRYIDFTWLKLEDANECDLLVIDAAKAALEDLHGVPTFMYVHIMAPHMPYGAPPPFDTGFDRSVEGLNEEEAELVRFHVLYDRDIAFADHLFGEVLALVREHGDYDNTIVAFVSDHGEQFYEHGDLGHGFSLFNEELLVPLIIKPRGEPGAPMVKEELVQLIDLAPTLLDLAGIPQNPGFQGQSLTPLFEGNAIEDRFAYSKLWLGNSDIQSVRSRDLKYIFNTAKASSIWYDLQADPLELSPLTAPPPGGEELQQYAFARSASDSAGLHIIVTDLYGSNRLLKGSVSVDGAESFDLWHAGKDFEVQQSEGSIQFEGRMKSPKGDDFSISIWMRNNRLTNFLRINTDAPMDSTVAITLTEFGQPIDPALAIGGQDRKQIPLDGTPIPITDLLAAPNAFALSTLPETFAIYAWYTAPTESIRDEDLPEGVLESLEALGYVR